VFAPVPSATGALVLQATGVRTAAADRHGGPGAPTALTGEQARRVDDIELNDDVDPVLAARVRQIAARLSLRRPRGAALAHRGRGRLAGLPYTGRSAEIDLDATMERLVEQPFPDERDIVVRDRRRSRRVVVLAVDVSGSMRGERVRTAAATVGALIPELADDDLAVIAFWSDAAVLAPLGRAQSAERVLDALLRIPARGLTNVSFPLELASRELARVPARDARVLLLSDCVHNAGPDPRLAAARLARLDVLLDTTGEHDEALGRDLARVGHGRFARVRDHREVAPALAAIFDT
jgi:Mg-chelatase subunit ChlD